MVLNDGPSGNKILVLAAGTSEFVEVPQVIC